jgi:hypothetical protein
MLEGLTTAFCGLLFYLAMVSWVGWMMKTDQKRQSEEHKFKEKVHTLGAALTRIEKTSEDATSRAIADAGLRKVYGD